MSTWDYCFERAVIARVRRPDDEPPYIGMPVCMVGRGGKIGPAENFVVAAFDPEQHSIALEWQQ